MHYFFQNFSQTRLRYLLTKWLVKLGFSLTLLLMVGLLVSPDALAFCGFYVARADSKLYNQASQVAISRKENQTVLTMANDYQGSVKDFAIVVPVPVVLKKDQVQVAAPQIIERLDGFSAPRLVEYFDTDPCAEVMYEAAPQRPRPSAAPRPDLFDRRTRNLGVTVEARYTVGEYDILILSAKESGGLATWLTRNGYKLPVGAKQLLQPYIRQNMKFFVAKVNLKEFNKAGFQALRPLQIRYDSPKFMLPIRLGMVNAKADQDLLVYILSPEGQAEVTNYRTVKIPTGQQIPVFVKNEFGRFYQAMFATRHRRENRNVAFLEYAWDMANCDPCAADPLSPEELRQAGVFWLDTPTEPKPPRPIPNGNPGSFRPGRLPPRSTSNVFITRLHVRYNRSTFPEDLAFQTTGNRELYQGRYVLRHPFKGAAECPAGERYRQSLPGRFEQEAQTLANLTNWKIEEIRGKLPQR